MEPPRLEPEAMVFFETGVVHVDGQELPIHQMFDKRGQPTDDPDLVALVIAGHGATWVSLRMLGDITKH